MPNNCRCEGYRHNTVFHSSSFGINHLIAYDNKLREWLERNEGVFLVSIITCICPLRVFSKMPKITSFQLTFYHSAQLCTLQRFESVLSLVALGLSSGNFFNCDVLHVFKLHFCSFLIKNCYKAIPESLVHW